MIENHVVLPHADPDDGEPGYCHAHQIAFTDYCEACNEERMLELRRDHEREIADETVEVLREIGAL